MGVLLALSSVALILLVLIDGFEAMVLPRRVSRLWRPSKIYFRCFWAVCRFVACWLPAGKRRLGFLGMVGPISLLGLFTTWVILLVVAFGLLHWSLEIRLNTPDQRVDFETYLYLSGVTFFTLGFGDVTAQTDTGRLLTVVEAGFGFGFMAVIIGYLPVLYQAFSRREVTISLLDARAGSPPSAAQLLLRLAQSRHVTTVNTLMAEWERWAAEVLESHLSFPVLSFYRSQHDNQSWLAALTMILDTCAFLIAGADGADPYQAQLTFAMARHTAVDLALVFQTPPRKLTRDRLPPERLAELRKTLRAAGLVLADGPAVDAKLTELRELYEPFVCALSQFLLYVLPPIMPEKPTADNWQTSAWTRRAPGIGQLPGRAAGDEHFD